MYANIYNRDRSSGSGGSGPGGSSTWSDVLTNGNTSGAKDAVMSTGQKVDFVDTIKVTSQTANSNIILGNGVTMSAPVNGVAIGASSSATATGSTALGANAIASGTNAYACGKSTTASGADSLALGSSASTAGFASSVAIGFGATNTAANQIQLGTNNFTTSNLGSFVMSTGLATGTTSNMLTLAKVAGTPTGAASSGTLCYDQTNNLFYARDNASWKQIQTGTVATPSWSSVLTAGNTTGANNPTINSGQSVIFTSGVAIGSAAVAPSTGTPAVNTVLIGGGTVGSGGNCVVIGRNATTSTFAFGTAVGSAATVSAANGTAVGYNATAAGSSTALGYLAVASGSQATAVGSGANVGTYADCTSLGRGAVCSNPRCIAIGSTTNTNTSTSATLIGTFATLGTLCDNTIVIGDSASAGNGTSDAIVIGTSSSAGAGATGAIVIGKAIALAANCANNTLIGNGISQATATSVNNSAVGASITFTAGASSTNTIALGAGATVPAGSVDRVYFTANFAAATAAAGTAVSIDSSGRFHANTSSIRYKQDVKPLRNPERILNIRAVDYAMKNSEQYGFSCGCPEYVLDAEGNSVRNSCDGLKCGVRDVGMIAEELANADCEDFVVFAPDPDDPTKRQCRSIKYDRLVGPIIEVLKLQKAKIEEQKTHMDFLDDENKMLLDRIVTLELEKDAMKSKLDWLESKILQLNV